MIVADMDIRIEGGGLEHGIVWMANGMEDLNCLRLCRQCLISSSLYVFA